MPKFLSELEPLRTKDGRFLVACACGWRGKRRVQDCECYDHVCAPESGGSGCPRGFRPCPRCAGTVHRVWPKAPAHEHCWGDAHEVHGIGRMEVCKGDYCPEMVRFPGRVETD